MPIKHVLLIDTHGERHLLLQFGLRCAGFSVDAVANDCDAGWPIIKQCPDIALLGGEWATTDLARAVQRLRDSPATEHLPVIVIADDADNPEASVALEQGADDYMIWPVSPEELVVRVHTVLRRGQPESLGDLITFGNVSLNRKERWVSKGTRTVPLAPTEARLAEVFFTHPERLITRELLRFRIWGGHATFLPRVVDVSVCRLRKALEQLGSDAQLRAVSGRGYRLSARADDRTARSSDR